MKILLHQRDGKKFYAGAESWTSGMSDAQEFKTVEAAARVAAGIAEPVEIVYVINNQPFMCSIPWLDLPRITQL